MTEIEYVYREDYTSDNNDDYYFDTTDTAVKIACPKCGGLVDPWDKYCRHCGANLSKRCPYCGKPLGA